MPPESEGEEGGPEQVAESTTAALHDHPEVARIREWRRSIHKAFHDRPGIPLDEYVGSSTWRNSLGSSVSCPGHGTR